MVTKLNNKQIEENWAALKEAIQAGVTKTPRNPAETSNAVLRKLLSGEAQAWVGLIEGRICLVCTTFFLYDPCEIEKSLFIYSLYGYAKITNEVWEEGRQKLLSFARGSGCSKITALSDVPRVVEIARGILGADTKTTYIYWEV